MGAAAAAVEGDVAALSGRLAWAESAFGTAGDALAGYAGAQAEAQRLAGRAMVDFQAAEHADAIARGAVVGAPVRLPGGVEPAREMARAVALLREAQDLMGTAERVLVAALAEAGQGAPTDPGRWAQFAMGVEEGLVGMATGAVALADVVGRLQPGRLFYDPVGWLQDWDAAVGAGWHAVSNPLETGAALLDVETLRENPTRWSGKLAPEVLLAVGTVGTAALAGRAGAAGRLRTVADDLDAAKRNGGVYPRVDPADIAARVGYLGHPPGSSAAARGRVRWSV